MMVSVAVWRINHGGGWKGRMAFQQLELPKELDSRSAEPRELEVIRQLGPKGVSVLEEALRSDVRHDRFKAAWALSRLGPVSSNAVPALVRAVDDPDASVAYYAIRTLTALKVSDADLVPRLVTKLGGKNAAVSVAAGDLLTSIEADRSAKNLPPAFDDEAKYVTAFLVSPSVRIQLMGIDRTVALPEADESVMTALKQLLTNQNQVVQRRAAAAFAQQEALSRK
ncbi:MAG: hypothetical protein KA236_10005 [Verrucomicrobia bacterium]|nr:hypothetical protein [Verrucomicrobiota bacterium]